MLFSRTLSLFWTSALLLSAHATADGMINTNKNTVAATVPSSSGSSTASKTRMLRGEEVVNEEEKPMLQLQLEEDEEHTLLPPATEDGFTVMEDFVLPEDVEIEFAPDDKIYNSTENGMRRKLASYSSAELEMAKHVNYERTKRGYRALSWSADLLDEAQRWASYMARTGNHRHRSPPSQNIRGWKYLAENIAYNPSVAYSGAHTSLMKSSGHRDNILNSRINRIGVGIRRGSNGYYYVCQIFKQV